MGQHSGLPRFGLRPKPLIDVIKIMNAVEIEAALSDLALEPFDQAEFPYQFLEVARFV